MRRGRICSVESVKGEASGRFWLLYARGMGGHVVERELV